MSTVPSGRTVQTSSGRTELRSACRGVVAVVRSAGWRSLGDAGERLDETPVDLARQAAGDDGEDGDADDRGRRSRRSPWSPARPGSSWSGRVGRRGGGQAPSRSRFLQPVAGAADRDDPDARRVGSLARRRLSWTSIAFDPSGSVSSCQACSAIDLRSTTAGERRMRSSRIWYSVGVRLIGFARRR